MAINSRKISSLPQLDTLGGSEYLMVAYNHKSYRIPTSLLISNVISTITQTQSTVDGGDNPIKIKLNDGSTYTFHVYNGAKGKKGDKGETGDKGARGESGVALYNTDVADLIINSVSGEGYTETELTELILSAAQGVILNDKLDDLKEVYLDTQTDYDNLVAEGKIDNTTKYLIYEE